MIRLLLTDGTWATAKAATIPGLRLNTGTLVEVEPDAASRTAEFVMPTQIVRVVVLPKETPC